MGKPKVSFIVPVYNAERRINQVYTCLEKLFEVNYPNFEVIVVDDASKDMTYRLVRDKWESKVKLIRNDVNLNYTGAVNKGFIYTDVESKYICPVNDDFFVERDIVKCLVEEMENHPETGMCSGIIMAQDRSVVSSAGIFIGTNGLWISRYEGAHPKEIRDESCVSTVHGCFYMVRRSCLSDFLLSGSFGYSYDEVELSFRLWSRGYSVMCIPSIAGTHLVRQTIGRDPALSKAARIMNWRNKCAVMYLYLPSRLSKKYIFLLRSLLGNPILFLEVHSRYALSATIDGIKLSSYLPPKGSIIPLMLDFPGVYNLSEVAMILSGRLLIDRVKKLSITADELLNLRLKYIYKIMW